MNEIKWHVNCQTFYSDERAAQMRDRICEALSIEEKTSQWNMVNEFCFLLSVTEDVEFDPDRARQPLHEFQTLIDTWETRTPQDLYDYRLRRLPGALLNQWREAYMEGQNLFEPDPAVLPEAALTEAQREELKDVNSPLVENALLSPQR
jgi:hypothetical protein